MIQIYYKIIEMVSFKIKLISTLIISLLPHVVYLQELKILFDNPESISDTIVEKIVEKVDSEIFRFRVQRNPEFSLSDYAKDYIMAKDQAYIKKYYESKSVLLDKQGIKKTVGPLILKVSPWRIKGKYLQPNYYIVEKNGNRLPTLNLKNGETIEMNVDLFDEYYPFGNRYLVYYKSGSERVFMISGSVFLESISDRWFFQDKLPGAKRAITVRTVMFNASYPLILIGEVEAQKEGFYLFEIKSSDLSAKSILARVPYKDNPRFENIELIYYRYGHPETEELGIFEVMYLIKTQPGSYKETQPIYRKLSHQEVIKVRGENYFRFFANRPEIKELGLEPPPPPIKKNKK